MDQDNACVKVTYNDGETGVFDLLIAADGVRSITKSLIFGDEPEIKFVGLYNVWLLFPIQKLIPDGRAGIRQWVQG